MKNIQKLIKESPQVPLNELKHTIPKILPVYIFTEYLAVTHGLKSRVVMDTREGIQKDKL
jgi:hypothetical protein